MFGVESYTRTSLKCHTSCKRMNFLRWFMSDFCHYHILSLGLMTSLTKWPLLRFDGHLVLLESFNLRTPRAENREWICIWFTTGHFSHLIYMRSALDTSSFNPGIACKIKGNSYKVIIVTSYQNQKWVWYFLYNEINGNQDFIINKYTLGQKLLVFHHIVT